MSQEKLRFAIVAGGTGGHIYPGIGIAEEIKRRYPDAEIFFLGSEEGLEKDLVPRAGFVIQLIWSRALIRKISYKAISAPFVSIVGFFQALKILRAFAPQSLISTGGYAGLPAVLAAKVLGIPIFIHEQNVLPGFTNRLLHRFAQMVFLSFDKSREYLPGIVVGNPVRREIIEADRESARRSLGYSPEEFVVLVMGGSQGARRINEAVVDALPMISEGRGTRDDERKLQIFHAVGHRDARLIDEKLAGRKYDFYRKVDYLYNIGEVLAAADLVISRAGATAIAEFLVRGVPMVLVPFPFSAEGHQDLNAEVVARADAARVINNGDFTPGKFVSIITGKDLDLPLMKTNCRKLARPGAAKEIVDALTRH